MVRLLPSRENQHKSIKMAKQSLGMCINVKSMYPGRTRIGNED